MRGVLFPVLGFYLAAWAGPVAGQPSFDAKVNAAVFSANQAFWPELAKARPAAPMHLVVLPIRIKESDWKESIPCDSCHRLSANGMEFFLENYLLDRMTRRFPGRKVELAAPHLPLVESAKISLLDYQDSLALPWGKWFDGYAQPLIYRPKDRFVTTADRRRLDRLGGILGATHLLLPAMVKVSLEPKARNEHTGHMEWGFHLLFWNVVEGRPEWAMAFSETARNVDLDQALDDRLDRALGAAWDRMPEYLTELWKAEPR